MDTKPLERFARAARQQLHEQVAARLDVVLGTDSAALRGYADAINRLKHELRTTPRPAVIERVAYTWFNRFCALRFMDAIGATPLRLVSPADGFTLPEILQEAKAGVFDDELSLSVDRKGVADLLAGRMRSGDPQGEAYRLLLVAACNAYHATMPFMFEPIADVTELLMPADLLSPNSVLHAAREVLTAEACGDVEVIGWLYQFYIAEKKDEVFAALKDNRKIAAEDIPAATQLFTPHWIVRYLVENSLGRLWLLNRPGSRLAERMPYYIAPLEPETDFLRLTSPEELRLCDPAVGSGHMLTYAFDLLYLIYEEEGYNPPDIPRLILEKNLYGVEIDERAGALAAFALTMKARGRDRRFLKRGVRPNICVLQPVTVTEQELAEAPWFRALGRNLVDRPARDALVHDLALFRQVDNIGSLLRPELTPAQIETLGARIGTTTDLLSDALNMRVQHALGQLAYLARKYHVVVANPPYMGGGGANDELRTFAQDYYTDSKADLFAMFIERNLTLAALHGLVAMITMQSWMFLASFERLRNKILDQKTILSMAHLGARAFDTIGGEVVSTTAFVIENAGRPEFKGGYLRLVAGGSEAEKESMLRGNIPTASCPVPADFYRASATEFHLIPGIPIAYWADGWVKRLFSVNEVRLQAVSTSDGQTKTGENDRFLRFLWEVSRGSAGSSTRWWLHPKGGAFRKWYGNVEYVIDWSAKAREHYRKDHVARILPEYLWFQKGISWTNIAGDRFSFRILEPGQIFNIKAPTLYFRDGINLGSMIGYLNSPIASRILKLINPTISLNVNEVRSLPVQDEICRSPRFAQYAQDCISTAKADWDSYETAWDFSDLPLLRPNFRRDTLADTYATLRAYWREATLEMQRLEEENNRIFIAAYGLGDELTPDVPLSEITLTCNPHYRYNSNKSEEELEALLRRDTLREFISYAVGCMFGRYSLDKPGLILANQGETVEDYLRIVDPSTALRSAQDAGEQESWGAGEQGGAEEHAPRTTHHAPRLTFLPDKDNVIPILDGDWFTDDIVARFGRFLRVTFGEAHYAENLAVIEAALGRDLRSFFVREFYDDHLKRYQRRPIYWLFSSPGGSFNALIYMHRYQPDTVSVVLNDYLREYQAKLAAARNDALHNSIAAGAANREKAAALKEVARLDKVLKELAEYETVLLDLARKQVQIDLDDGVKVNYAKFGPALRRVVGLNA